MNPLDSILDLPTLEPDPGLSPSLASVTGLAPLTVLCDGPESEPATAINLAGSGLSVGDRVLVGYVRRALVCLGRVAGPATGYGAWRAPTLLGSWSNYSGFGVAAFRREGDVVRLSGTVLGGTGGSGDPLATLPPDCRPSSTRLLSAASGGGATLDLRVSPAGAVYLNAASSPGWVSLEGLTYRL